MLEEKQTGQESENSGIDETEARDLENKSGQLKTSADIAAELQEKYKDLTAEEILQKVSEDLAKKNEIISNKNRAINALKTPKEKIEAKPIEEAKPEDIESKVKTLIDNALSSFQTSAAVEAKIASISSDLAEQSKIREAYNNSIVKSGDVEADLKKALAIANFSIIEDYKKTKSEAEVNELMMTKFMGGQSSSGQEDGNPLSDPIKRAAHDNMIKAGVTPELALKAIKNM